MRPFFYCSQFCTLFLKIYNFVSVLKKELSQEGGSSETENGKRVDHGSIFNILTSTVKLTLQSSTLYVLPPLVYLKLKRTAVGGQFSPKLIYSIKLYQKRSSSQPNFVCVQLESIRGESRTLLLSGQQQVILKVFETVNVAIVSRFTQVNVYSYNLR